MIQYKSKIETSLDNINNKNYSQYNYLVYNLCQLNYNWSFSWIQAKFKHMIFKHNKIVYEFSYYIMIVVRNNFYTFYDLENSNNIANNSVSTNLICLSVSWTPTFQFLIYLQYLTSFHRDPECTYQCAISRVRSPDSKQNIFLRDVSGLLYWFGQYTGL